MTCAILARCQPVVTSDADLGGASYHLRRSPELAQDNTPMIDVVKHALAEIPGEPDQKIVLLQPTQPLREPKHITQALDLLTPDVDSVVSLVEVPRTHHPAFQCQVRTDHHPQVWGYEDALHEMPATRQEVKPTYIRDGTVYAFWRKTVTEFDSIYGVISVPLIIPPAETAPLDTELDWREAERRLKERAG